MATKTSGTLVLIIEKRHAPWDLMVTALPALELHFRCQLRIASARPILLFGAVGPMCQSGGSCVCRAVLWLAIGLHTVQWTAEACLAAAGLMYCEFGCMLASYGAPTVLEACIEHCRGCVSGGLRGQNGTCSLYQSHSTLSWMCTARTEAMVTIGQAVLYE